MALRVGMRVKKVRGAKSGVTGVVVGFDPSPLDPVCDIQVSIDTPWTSDFGVNNPAGEWGWTCSSNWEPIIPEGHKPVEWSQCLWAPEHIREGVSA